MKHTIKLLTLAFMLATILTLTGCPGPVNTVDVWDNGVVTTAPTCTTEGVKTFTCSNGETRTETIPALGHDYQGGYCERCGVYEFDYHLTIKVFTSLVSFEEYTNSINTSNLRSQINTSNFEEVKYSFNERELYTSINELLSLKDRFKNKNVIASYGDVYGDVDVNTELYIDFLAVPRIAILIETE